MNLRNIWGSTPLGLLRSVCTGARRKNRMKHHNDNFVQGSKRDATSFDILRHNWNLCFKSDPRAHTLQATPDRIPNRPPGETLGAHHPPRAPPSPLENTTRRISFDRARVCATANLERPYPGGMCPSGLRAKACARSAKTKSRGARLQGARPKNVAEAPLQHRPRRTRSSRFLTRRYAPRAPVRETYAVFLLLRHGRLSDSGSDTRFCWCPRAQCLVHCVQRVSYV